MTGNRSQLPPTPCKSKTVKRRNSCKRRFHKGLESKAFTPSPKKRRKVTPKSFDSQSADTLCPKFFHNLGVCGAGSFAKVYKVQNARNKKIFALKQSQNKDGIDNEMNEVEIMELLQKETTTPEIIGNLKEEMDDEKDEESVEIENSNEHIAKFYDYWISNKRQLHQVYEYYEHGTLANLISHNARFNHLQILETLRQLCDGLRFVHSKNVIHIDLKPDNIFISNDFIFKIGDFGVSINCNIDPDETPRSLKKKHRVQSGDPIYIAPELLSFERALDKNVDTKTDIFSLGIILLEMLCDIKAPSQGPVFQNLRNGILDFCVLEPSPRSNKMINVEVMSQIDDEIKDLCMHMLRKQSDLRPDCTEIIGQIDEILSNEKYCQYFAQSDGLKQLALAPETVVEEKGQESDGNVFYQQSPRTHSPAASPEVVNNLNNHNRRSPLVSPIVSKNLSSMLHYAEKTPLVDKKKERVKVESERNEKGSDDFFHDQQFFCHSSPAPDTPATAKKSYRTRFSFPLASPMVSKNLRSIFDNVENTPMMDKKKAERKYVRCDDQKDEENNFIGIE